MGDEDPVTPCCTAILPTMRIVYMGNR